MLSFVEYIFESMDRPYQWRRSSPITYRFTTNNGNEYKCAVKNITDVYGENGEEYGFYEFKFTTDTADVRTLTGMYDNRVFATVIEILEHILKDEDIAFLDISGTSEKRSKIYMKIANRLNHKLSRKHIIHKHYEDIFIVRKDLNIDYSNLEKYIP